MSATLQRTEHLYALVHPKRGMIYGLGPNRTDAWDNGCLVLFGHIWNSDEERANTMTEMRRHGWRVRKVEVTYDV